MKMKPTTHVATLVQDLLSTSASRHQHNDTTMARKLVYLDPGVNLSFQQNKYNQQRNQLMTRSNGVGIEALWGVPETSDR